MDTIRHLYSQLASHDNEVLDVSYFARQVGNLKAFPQESPLLFLGYFAILESLLAHKPAPTDPYQSITRQVLKKVALLDNRWSPNLDYSGFSGMLPDKIWKKMYSYRSALAHGEKPSFENELAVLKNHDLALSLLRDATKAVVRFALFEPQLIVDLRDC